MFREMYWTWMWAIAGGSGTPFQWTVTMSGFNGSDVLAEAELSKLIVPQSGGAKTSVLSAQYGPYTYTGTGVQQSSNNWGIDGAPMRYLPTCSYLRFALEVSGSSTYAWMIGKVYIY
jgi:hypothetical protein